MKKNAGVREDPQDLRSCAEGLLKAKGSATGQSLTLEESQRLVHELQVHQIELELQNEELHRTRNELEVVLANYADLYDFAPVGYITLGCDGTIRAINLTGADLLGVVRSKLVNRWLGLYISPGTRAVFANFLNKVFASKARETCEVVFLKEKISPLFVQIEAVTSESGQECRAALIDLTERKKLEQQLLQAQKMESIGLLAGGVAHDFNNLLTIISFCGETILENIPADDELLQESIGQALKAVARAAILTGNLLAFSRKQLTNPQPVAIEEIIDDTSKLIKRVISEDIEISIISTCKKMQVMADASQIEQVLINLAINARDAMPGGGRLAIATREMVVEEGSEALYDLPAPGRYVLISVADTGNGIDKEALGRIFEPFYSTKEVGKGTGLGLSIVHGIIKQHGGSVLVNSEPGKGTTFNIYLPLLEVRAVRPESKKPAPHVGGSENILVVEDDEVVRFLTKRILETAGYRVIAADNGEEAVARFKEHDDISLILSDVIMPRKNGKEMFDELKRIKPGIKVIFITGYSADIIQSKGLNDEGVNFLTKPFDKIELLQKTREVLDRG